MGSTGATHIEKYFKKDDIWQLSVYTSLSDIIKLQSLEIQVLMSDVYAGVHSGN